MFGVDAKPKADKVDPVAIELARDKATNMMGDVWMRDPFICHFDGKYYLTYTDGKDHLPVWTSTNLEEWTKMEECYTLPCLNFYDELKASLKSPNENVKLWAPEIHRVGDEWVLLHTTNVRRAAILTSKSATFNEFEYPYDGNFGHHHDPSFFVDDDGSRWLVDLCGAVTKFKDDMSGFEGKMNPIKPSDRRMGHEGSQIVKVDGKYVWFGTAWSTDEMRHGTYNLYYATSDNLTGPYSERRLAGYCLGHGTIFKDETGQWWCTAFRNGGDKITEKNKALTINPMGLTLVPMEVTSTNGDIFFKPLDERYAKDNTGESIE